jgi:glycolate oxidase FAD binding subunit
MGAATSSPAHTPSSATEVAEALAAHAGAGRSVRIAGGGTKLGWGPPVHADATLSTAGLDAIQEHNPGDLTAVLEAGVRLADAQAAFARHRQRLALDPPLGAGAAATIGGALATADSGPLRHRYGALRDLVIGVTLALPDGTLAHAGGKVIKNVAGYDLAKLSAGAFGTLGVVVQVAVRLHPAPRRTASAVARTDDPGALARAAQRLARSPLETDALDFASRGGHGGVLARYGGAAAAAQARDAAALLGREPGVEAEVLEDDDEAWAQQRVGQRSADGVVLRVAAVGSDLEGVVRAARAAGASAVGRAAVGTSWLTLPAGAGAAEIRALRSTLAPRPCTILDAPEALRAAVDPWPEIEPGLLALSRRLKERFDPGDTCNPRIFVGGL